jgi:hypothetical protein
LPGGPAIIYPEASGSVADTESGNSLLPVLSFFQAMRDDWYNPVSSLFRDFNEARGTVL